MSVPGTLIKLSDILATGDRRRGTTKKGPLACLRRQVGFPGGKRLAGPVAIGIMS